jgi:hypothetical protein
VRFADKPPGTWSVTFAALDKRIGLYAPVDFLSTGRLAGTHFHGRIVRQDRWSSQPLGSYYTMSELYDDTTL